MRAPDMGGMGFVKLNQNAVHDLVSDQYGDAERGA
jgi:hypothetical protein